MDQSERINRLRLIRTPHIGPVTCRLLLQRYGNAQKAIAAVPELSARGGRKLTPISVQEAEAEFQEVERAGAQLVIYGSDKYPKNLLRFDDAPIVLTTMGDLSLLDKTVLAIVGARNASINACRLTKQFATALGQHDLVIISGMARGIDRAAHEGSLKTGSVAVLANGIDVPYPRDNTDIYNALKDHGLLMTEMRIGTQPAARLFPSRNRIIASLSIGCLVIEAALKSGSLITAREAVERGSDVMAIPGSPLDPRAQGCNALIQDGANLVQSPEDVIALLDRQTDLLSMSAPYTPKAPVLSAPADQGDVDKARACILENLSHDPIDIDELGRWCHVSAEVMAAALLELELGGSIQRHIGSRVSRLVDMV